MLFSNRKYFSIPFGEWQLIIHAVSNVECHRSKLIDIPSSWLVISRLLIFFARGLLFKGFMKPRASGRNIVGQQLPTLWDVTCCVCFTPCCMLLYVFACCWELLRKGWKRSNFWASNSQHFFCSVIVEAWDRKTMLDPYAQLFQHCWGHARALHMVSKVLWGSILPIMHCRSQHCWELLHPFEHHCRHERNNYVIS